MDQQRSENIDNLKQQLRTMAKGADCVGANQGATPPTPLDQLPKRI